MAEAAALWQAGQQHIRARRLPAARESFEKLLRLQPGHVPARLLLASVHLAEGRVRPALAQVLAAAQALPPDVVLISKVAQALRQLGETVVARHVLAHPAIAATSNSSALIVFAQLHQEMNQHHEALALLDRALAIGPDTADLRYLRALQLQFHGRLAEAEAEFEACLARAPTHGRASVTLARLREATPARNQLAMIGQRLAQVAKGSEDEAAFEFARYTELEALGRYDEAWTALARGNALMFERVKAQAAFDDGPLIDAIEARATPAFFAQTAPAIADNGPTPIFVIGMPRSGTSLLESLLGRHSRIAAAGELIEFGRAWRFVADVHGHRMPEERLLAADTDFAEVGRRYLAQTRWRARGREFYVDKMPPNFWLAGFIRKALPQARILHLVREPMELCFSNWRALFGESYAYSYELAALAAYHANYSRLMRHWHAAMPGAIHDVDYAALAADPEGTLRATLAHIGVDFEAACLDHQIDAGPVATLSSAQVRAPPSDHGRRDWERYATQLEPLRLRLGEP